MFNDVASSFNEVLKLLAAFLLHVLFWIESVYCEVEGYRYQSIIRLFFPSG